MKKTIITVAITTLIAGTMLSSCLSSAEKVEKAEAQAQEASDKSAEAQRNLDQIRQDSIADYQEFRLEAEEKIAAHEKSIADFKARIAKEKRENRAKYENKLAALEQKNSDMKKRLADYKEEGKDKWDAFKTEFKHDMEQIGKAFNDLTINSAR